MRRLLSAGVPIREAPKAITILEEGTPIGAYMPTESEVRDALARVAKALDDMRIARGEGWEPTELQHRVVVHDDGSTELRGFLEITRPD